MKLNRLCCLLLAVFLLAGCDSATTTEPAESTPANTESDSSSKSAADETADTDTTAPKEFVIDVRSQKEWDEGHLETAIHIPHTEIVEGIAKVTDDKNAKICLH